MKNNSMLEQGPEAAATQARLTDRRTVMLGEGSAAFVGRDGDTFCVVTEEGTLLDLLPEAEVSEADWRGATRIRRFSTEYERDAHVVSRGWAVKADGEASDAPRPVRPGRFHLELEAGMTSSRAEVDVAATSEGITARLGAVIRDRRAVREDIAVPADEWARFEAELGLLTTWRWRDFGVGAVDGLRWAMQHERYGRVDSQAAGVNSYPPDGDPDISQEFLRMLLAADRLLGRTVWPGFDTRAALDDIPDERDRVEHLLLAAMRDWGEETEQARVDPADLTEVPFEKALLPHLQGLEASSRRQVGLRKTIGRPAVLDRWPGVGSLDIALDVPSPVWVELKWAKNADTLHNCLWDAAKLARAIRDGKATHGYLLAGAPRAQWELECVPRRLFTVSAHVEDTIVSGYGDNWWPRWARESQAAYPRLLPTPIVTVPVGRAFVRSQKDQLWELRLARVEAPGDGEFVPPYLVTE